MVFLGRSNVGKSSLINRLLGVKGLARISSRPGRTQSVNFYRINDSFHFVDLPGYGYAEVPERVRRQWKPMVEGFLARRRERIAAAILVVDARHGATPLDGVMREWLEEARVPYLVAGTKSDRISGNEREAVLRQLREVLGARPGGDAPILVSARTGDGVREIWARLDRALGAASSARAGSSRRRRERSTPAVSKERGEHHAI